MGPDVRHRTFDRRLCYRHIRGDQQDRRHAHLVPVVGRPDVPQSGCFFILLIDVAGFAGWTILVRPAGANPLLAYFLHPIMVELIGVLGLGNPLLSYQGLEQPLSGRGRLARHGPFRLHRDRASWAALVCESALIPCRATNPRLWVSADQCACSASSGLGETPGMSRYKRASSTISFSSRT